MSTLRERLGCWLHERWRAEIVLSLPWLAGAFGWSWMDLRNRRERLRVEPVVGGRECLWADSSRYVAARMFPALARRLLSHVLRQWPIAFNRSRTVKWAEYPSVSILIPVGGTERMAQFELALWAARAQTGVSCEIVVVEQSLVSQLTGCLPDDVRLLHQQIDTTGGFNKSAALNFGARAARGEVLLIVDADYLIPTRFASECVRALRKVEGVRPARWIFYLDAASTASLHARTQWSDVRGLDAVVANNPTPIAIRRSTYWDIGGHDEAYVGWGGEDTEFLDRLRTRKISEGGWLPVVHAWHAPAPKKADGDRNAALHTLKMQMPVASRIRGLRSAKV